MSQLIVKMNFDRPNHFYASGSLTHKTCMLFVHEINTHLNSFSDLVVIDISKLNHLDGSGLGVIVTLAICLNHQRKRLIIEFPEDDSQPKQVLNHLKLTHILEARPCHTQSV